MEVAPSRTSRLQFCKSIIFTGVRAQRIGNGLFTLSSRRTTGKTCRIGWSGTRRRSTFRTVCLLNASWCYWPNASRRPTFRQATQLELNTFSMTLNYRIVRLWEIEGSEALALNSPRFLALMPLLRTSEKQLTQAVERIAREPDRDDRAAELSPGRGITLRWQ